MDGYDDGRSGAVNQAKVNRSQHVEVTSYHRGYLDGVAEAGSMPTMRVVRRVPRSNMLVRA